MVIGGAEDHGLLFPERIQFLCQRMANNLIEGFVDHPLVEGIHLEVEIVLQLRRLNFARAGIDGRHHVALVEIDPLLGQLGLETDRRFVVDQPIISHRLTIGVEIDRLAENLAGVFCWCGCEANFDRIEIVENSTVA